MYDLFLVGLVLAIQHIAVSYAAIEIWKLEYKAYLAVTVGVGLAVAAVLRASSVLWKDRIDEVMRGEWAEGELPLDVLLFFATMIGGAWVTATLVWRRYGVAGWAGAVAANYAASWIV